MSTMIDPTNDQLLVPDPSFMDDYDFGGQYTPPPQAKVKDEKGRLRYVEMTARAPKFEDIQTRDEQGRYLRTNAQPPATPSLKAILKNVTLIESNYQVQQTHLSASLYRKFKNGQPTGETRNASQFIDYLHSQGIEAKPATPDQYEEFVKATAEGEFRCRINWSAYDKDSKSSVAEKWEDFPDDPENPGSKLPFIEKDGKRFWARASIQGFVSAITK